MPVTVRTRGNIATFTVDCVNNEQHVFTVTKEGVFNNPHHNPDHDAVMEALGGGEHACAKAAKIFTAGVTINNAETGLADNPKAKFFARGWRTNSECNACTYRTFNINHVNSNTHVLETSGIPEMKQQLTTVLRWLRRDGNSSKVFKNFNEVQNVYPFFENVSRRFYIPNNLKPYMFTPAYIESVIKIFGNDFIPVYQLRAIYGIKTQWIQTLSETLTPKTIERIREENTIFKVLSGARHSDPLKVAEFLNAGVYANIYTYITHNAKPEEALRVYKATSGSQTLAGMLREGHSIPGAVRSVISA